MALGIGFVVGLNASAVITSGVVSTLLVGVGVGADLFVVVGGGIVASL